MLIGGLGMGFTLAAVLASVGTGAQVTVAELIPEVADWNRGPLAEFNGYALNDSRCDVQIADVCDLIRDNPNTYDVIALDVDNGPEGLTRRDNNWLYTEEGVRSAGSALKPGGVLAYWSASDDKAFRVRLQRCRFKVEQVRVFAYGKKGTRHTIWLAEHQRSTV